MKIIISITFILLLSKLYIYIKTSNTKEKFLKNSPGWKKKPGFRFQCPVRDSCKNLIIKNRSVTHRLISPKCLVNAVFEDED